MKLPFHPVVYYASVLIALVGVSWFWSVYQKDKAELIAIVGDVIKEQRENLVFIQKELSMLRTENNELLQQKEEEIADQDERLQELARRLANFQSAPKVNNTTDIVHEWAQSVFKVSCRYTRSRGSSFTQTGSGLGFNLKESAIFITNKHVLINQEPGTLDECLVSQNGKDVFEIDIRETRVDTELDFAYMTFGQPQTFFTAELSSSDICRASSVHQGEALVILGYPVTGARDSVTVTEGIIAGSEEDYYVTSAKIEQGNSGGAAVLTSQSCLLGLPTFAQVGRVESLARILKLEKLFEF